MSVKKYKINEHNLPVPRLQVKIKPHKDGHNVEVIYSLIKYQVHGMEDVILTKSKFISSTFLAQALPRPHTTFAHLLHDMWTMNVPGFLISSTDYEEIKLAEEVASIPNGLWQRMENTPDRREEFLLLEEILMKKRQERNTPSSRGEN